MCRFAMLSLFFLQLNALKSWCFSWTCLQSGGGISAARCFPAIYSSLSFQNIRCESCCCWRLRSLDLVHLLQNVSKTRTRNKKKNSLRFEGLRAFIVSMQSVQNGLACSTKGHKTAINCENMQYLVYSVTKRVAMAQICFLSLFFGVTRHNSAIQTQWGRRHSRIWTNRRLSAAWQ